MNIVFLGDSITDAERSRTPEGLSPMGTGYPLLVDAKLSVDAPGKYQFFNSGIGGNRVIDLYERLQADVWQHEPDVLSILVGVNDVYYRWVSEYKPVDSEQYIATYKKIIEESRTRYPALKIVLMEPFLMHGSATDLYWDEFRNEILSRAQMVKALSKETHCCFVPLQEIFQKACESYSEACWTRDGIHPTPGGHQLIANAWIQAFHLSYFNQKDNMA